ncbi:TetR/AcrR family transcriptional regulator [Corynebacterium sp. YSMAA1_1_F7]|uniref:TetR/AcrR family transcriptional regulator n=1 Tax=Corynebacterium sp. YSMAA1_1_F7 TaxID=3383590 RepID=UPI0038D0C2A7
MSSHYLAEPNTEGLSARAAAKEHRRVELLRAAARIMANKGFHGTSLEEVGEAAGISGPAVYRHFPGKEEILTELMTGISEHMLSEAQKIVDGLTDPRERLAVLIDFQVDFALSQPELIRLHNRELFRMGEAGRGCVRSVQGSYLKLFAEALAKMDSHYQGEAGRITAQLVVGMINSSEVIRGWASTALARRQMLAAARAAVGLE